MAKHGKVKETIEFSDMPEVWKHLIRRCAETVTRGKFTAGDVAMLMPIARPTQRGTALRDLADGLAHPVRDKGHSQYPASKLDAFNLQTPVQAGDQPLGDVTDTNPKPTPAIARIDNAEVSRELQALLGTTAHLPHAGNLRPGVSGYHAQLVLWTHDLLLTEDGSMRRDV
jgi:hypothetical protein